MLHEGVTTGRAAKYISRHPKTLQAMVRAGVRPARRTASGRRYWLRPDRDLGRTAAERPRPTVCYGRVSSQAQRPDGKNQRRIVEEFAIAQGRANLECIEEMGGGLNCKQPKFKGAGGFRGGRALGSSYCHLGAASMGVSCGCATRRRSPPRQKGCRI